MATYNDPVGAFQEVAARQPEHPAVIDGDSVVTYRELADDVMARSAALLTREV